jgi:plastocyanin
MLAAPPADTRSVTVFTRQIGSARSAARGASVASALLGCLLASAATPNGQAGRDTGGVDGQVHIVVKSSRRLASAGAYPGRTVGIASEHGASEFANVMVFVKARTTPSRPTRVAIRQSDEEFLPHLVAVTSGSTVDFPNEDLIFHNVFSLSRASTFDLGRYPRGSSRSRVFTTPGLVKVFCQLHSHMSAIIRVFDHPYFAIPDLDGRFAIPNLSPGAYDVVAWHERVGEVTLRASVVAGQTTRLSFSLPLTDVP